MLLYLNEHTFLGTRARHRAKRQRPVCLAVLMVCAVEP
jgi:hypothetical protein